MRSFSEMLRNSICPSAPVGRSTALPNSAVASRLECYEIEFTKQSVNQSVSSSFIFIFSHWTIQALSSLTICKKNKIECRHCRLLLIADLDMHPVFSQAGAGRNGILQYGRRSQGRCILDDAFDALKTNFLSPSIFFTKQQRVSYIQSLRYRGRDGSIPGYFWSQRTTSTLSELLWRMSLCIHGHDGHGIHNIPSRRHCHQHGNNWKGLEHDSSSGHLDICSHWVRSTTWTRLYMHR